MPLQPQCLCKREREIHNLFNLCVFCWDYSLEERTK